MWLTGLVSVLALVGGSAPAAGQDLPQSVPGTEVVLSALDSVWVVALGETHGHLEFHDLLLRMLSDQRVQAVVDDIVVEFGNPRYQAVVDRYTRGAASIHSVRPAWRNTVVSPNTVWDSPVYERFFVVVRRINQRRGDGRRYRIVLADAPVDWSAVRTRADLDPYRDRVQAMTVSIQREVLARGRKALFVAGGAHTSRVSIVRTDRHGVPTAEVSVVAGLLLRHPGSVFVVRSLGRTRVLAHDRLGSVPRGSILPVRGSPLEKVAANDVSTMRNADGSAFVGYGRWTVSDMADAVIYWGPEAENTFVPPDGATYRDEVYWTELNRRSEVVRGRSLPSRRGAAPNVQNRNTIFVSAR